MRRVKKAFKKSVTEKMTIRDVRRAYKKKLKSANQRPALNELSDLNKQSRFLSITNMQSYQVKAMFDHIEKHTNTLHYRQTDIFSMIADIMNSAYQPYDEQKFTLKSVKSMYDNVYYSNNQK